MLKHAESGTGGIPRRAFNNPRAMESLGASNLSNQLVPRIPVKTALEDFMQGGAFGIARTSTEVAEFKQLLSKAPFGDNGFAPPVGADPNTPRYNNPSQSGQTYVRSNDATKARIRIDARRRQADARAARTKDANRKATLNRLSTALRAQSDQIKSDLEASRRIHGTRLGGSGEAIKVPNWTLRGNAGTSAFDNGKPIKPYGTRTPTTIRVQNGIGENARSADVEVG